MIAYTTLLLFFIGIFSSIKVGVKVDKTLSFFTFASLFFVFSGFCDAFNAVREHIFTFTWNTATGSALVFDIISNSYNYWLVLPCFVLTMLSALNSFFFHYEERRSAYLSVLILNLVALIILITSNNFVQLLSALFVIDILALFLIKDVEACRRYVLLNMLADMILFAVLAVINCRVASLDIKQIILYRSNGMHQDFVALAGLTAVFAKFGFFLFQIGITDLSKIRFHRMQNILFLSSPLAAMILLLKFSVLWRTSHYFTAYTDIICVCSIVWGGLGGLLADNFKSKIIYWQMSFWALFVELLRFHGFIWFSGFSFLLLEMYALTSALYLLYYYGNRRVSMRQIGSLPLTNKKATAFVLLIMVAQVAAMSNTLTILYNNINRYYIWTFAAIFVFSLSAVLNQLLVRKSTRIKSFSVMPKKVYVIIELMILCALLLQDWRLAEPSVWGIAIIFALLCAYNPLRKTEFVYGMQEFQNMDVLGRLYHVLIKSLRLSGKFFWLLIDRLFMEKILLAFFASMSRGVLRFFRNLYNGSFGSVLAFALVILLLWLSYWSGSK